MKRLLIAAFSITSFALLTAPAHAISLCPTDSQYSGLCGLDIGSAIGNAVSFIYLIAIILALFYLLWGGLKWITSAGDKTALQTAREHLIAAIVGLIIIFLSYLILTFVAKFFLGQDFDLGVINLPTIDGSSSTRSCTPPCDSSAGFVCTGGRCTRP